MYIKIYSQLEFQDKLYITCTLIPSVLLPSGYLINSLITSFRKKVSEDKGQCSKVNTKSCQENCLHIHI